MQCQICYRKADNKYCPLHNSAYTNIVQAYSKWNSSKIITWTDFLKKVIDNSNSGLWVIDVCKHLLSKEQLKSS